MEMRKELVLPCGVTLPNRIAKSAMSENMASPRLFPGDTFYNAYKMWIEGDVGLCISGNIMVDSNHLGEVNNVVIEEGLDNHKELERWASSSNGSKSHIWIQLNHPGKQSPKYLNDSPVAPSASALKPPLDKMFSKPSELTEIEILNIIDRFGYAAKVVKDCGFEGVQIHGAHGYLVSQFLSPNHNQRHDQWGGSIENRMRFVVKIYEKMRSLVGSTFPISIKINSADFSRGGFTHEEAIKVTKKLSELGIDLIELSGGSYEEPSMMGKPIKESTREREAYFIEFAADIKEVISCPLMVTGGFRSADFMEECLGNEQLDIIGMGRALCLDPGLPKKLLKGESPQSQVKPLTSGIKILDAIFPLEIIWYTMQIHLMGKNKRPMPRMSVYRAIFFMSFQIGIQSLKRVRS